MAVTQTPVKEWEFRTSCQARDIDQIIFELQGKPKLQVAYAVGEEYMPYRGLLVGANVNDEDSGVSVRIRFDATDGNIRQMLRNLAYRSSKSDSEDFRHQLFVDFGEQMRAQGFPRSVS